MKNRTALVLLVLALALASVAAAAQANVVGKWKGKLIANRAKIPKPKNAEERAQMEAALKALSQATAEIEFKKDMTFVATMTLAPGLKQVTTGAWKIDGRVVSTRGTKINGKDVPSKELKWRTMSLSADGKTLVKEMDESKGQMRLEFRKAG